VSTSTVDSTDPRTRRHEAKRARIVAAAWELARRDGVGAISLRELAAAVELRQPSLYAYFASKLDLYDAMFHEGNSRLLERLDALPPTDDAREAVKRYARAFTEFALEDPARCALLLQRPIPGFEPTADSYAVAQQVVACFVERLHAAGMVDPGDVDCMTAMVGGLIDAQQSNDPGGDRWVRHLDRLVELHLDDAQRQRHHRQEGQ